MKEYLSLAEMKARGYEDATIEAARHGPERKDAVEALCEQIRRAFAGVKLGNGVGLMQGQGLDDYADGATIDAYRAKDEKDEWSRIPVEKLNECHSSLSFFDAEGMRFHLPAYLIAALHGEYRFDLTFTLTYRLDIRPPFSLLNSFQRTVVRTYLLFVSSDDSGTTLRPIRRALDGYWQEPDQAKR